MENKLFLTGRPRSGKTTLLQQALRNVDFGGFAVQRLLKQGETWAFRLLDLSQEPYIAQIESSKPWDDIVIHMSEPGKWRGIKEVFNEKGVLAVNRVLPHQLLVMDELGIFESDAHLFQNAVHHVMSSDCPILGVIKQKSSPFLDSIRSRTSITILTIDPANPAQAAPILQDFLLRAV